MISASEVAVPDWDYSMDNIFISTLPEPIESWLTAFPELRIVDSVTEVLKSHDQTVVWLHQPSLQAKDFQQTIQSIKAIRAENALCKIVVLANQPDTAQTVALIQAGAQACSHVYADPSVLVKVQHVVSEGGLWLGEAALQQLIEATKTQVSSSAISVDTLMAKLTRREQQVAEQVAKGLTNKQIARELEITERTVKAHMASIFERLGAKDRLQLALMLTQKS